MAVSCSDGCKLDSLPRLTFKTGLPLVTGRGRIKRRRRVQAAGQQRGPKYFQVSSLRAWKKSRGARKAVMCGWLVACVCINASRGAKRMGAKRMTGGRAGADSALSGRRGWVGGCMGMHARGSGRLAFGCTELLRGGKGGPGLLAPAAAGWRRRRHRQRSAGGRRLLSHRRLSRRLLGSGFRRRCGLALGGGRRLGRGGGLLGLRHRDQLKLHLAQVVVQLGFKAVASSRLHLAPLRAGGGGVRRQLLVGSGGRQPGRHSIANMHSCNTSTLSDMSGPPGPQPSCYETCACNAVQVTPPAPTWLTARRMLPRNMSTLALRSVT